MKPLHGAIFFTVLAMSVWVYGALTQPLIDLAYINHLPATSAGHELINRESEYASQKHWDQKVSRYIDYRNSEPLKMIREEDRAQLLFIYRQKNFSEFERKRLSETRFAYFQDYESL